MHQALADHLSAAAPSITSPPHFLAVVWSFLASLAQKQIDTPEERDAIEKVIMDAYDKLAASIAKTNQVVGLVFAAFRATVKDWIDKMLLALAPALPPTPTPVPVVIPTGSVAP